MAAVSERVEKDLTSIFGEGRVRTDLRERSMYSFDIGAMPRLVKPFVPAGVAGAVVRPQSEAQIVELAKYAEQEGLRLTPRGWSTSGYGGALPMEGSVVVSLAGMQHVSEIDPAAQTATVEAGAIWENVEKELAKQGLALRLYPSSHSSSSVAGWLAQGGAGFGSFEYGSFKDNVVSARVVLPGGEVREFSGAELLNYIAEAEGITGIITSVTFRVRPLEPEVHRLISLPDAAALASVLAGISAEKLPVWSITFLNPESSRLKKRLPHRHAHKWEIEQSVPEPVLPETYLLTIAYPESRQSEIDEPLKALIAVAGGEELAPGTAEYEWSQRFAPMRLKRIGPSIIPTEVVVPLAELPVVLDEIGEKVKQQFVLEGMVARGDQVVLLGFIPHDERSLRFNFAFALSLSVIRIAKAHGGSAYSTGLYFRREADSVLGAEKVRALREFKQSIDPRDLMNPGKVLGRGTIDTLMGTAARFEPLIRPIANAAKRPERAFDATRDVRGIPGDVAFMAYACARCGYCVSTCEQYSGRGWESQSPRGKYAFIRQVIEGRQTWDRKAIDTILVCTTCEVCNVRCQVQLPVEHNWMQLRGKLIHEQKRGTFPPFEMMAASLQGERDIWAGKAEHRADWVPEDLKPKLKPEGSLLYFAGCTASFVENDIAEASVRLLTDAGYDIAYMGTDEACCGIPMKMAGRWDIFEDIYKHNVAEARKRGVKTIVTSCPACGLVWKEMYANLAAEHGEEYEFEVKHYSELVADALAAGRLELKNPVEGRFTFHDSCHLGRAQGIYDPPRTMLEAIPGIDLVEMEHNRQDAKCCGSVATLVGEIAVGPVLGGDRLEEAVAVGADTLVAACPCCQVQLRDSAEKNGFDLKIDDLARLVAQSAGYDIPSSASNASYMWGYFDKFIRLMAPAEMAKLMTAVFPQMLDAMPFGMKPMMLGMKRIPGALSLMEKVMPVMFPMLAPGILGKVMPDLIAAVQRFIGPMPADMEALMPDLLPKTMEALMPTYLPQLIPHLTPLFIGFVRNDT
ncbi:MAG: FAD-binding and (Fe-S)-binding domain-containing protein [Coriobacteriia bacterium]